MAVDSACRTARPLARIRSRTGAADADSCEERALVVVEETLVILVPAILLQIMRLISTFLKFSLRRLGFIWLRGRSRDRDIRFLNSGGLQGIRHVVDSRLRNL